MGDNERPDIDELIGNSSLGTDRARRLQAFAESVIGQSADEPARPAMAGRDERRSLREAAALLTAVFILVTFGLMYFLAGPLGAAAIVATLPALAAALAVLVRNDDRD